MWHPMRRHLFVDLSVWFSCILFIVEINKIRLIIPSYKFINLLIIKIHKIDWNVFVFFVASEAAQGKIKQQAVVLDPIGAILISVYIMVAWILQANSKCCLFPFKCIWTFFLLFSRRTSTSFNRYFCWALFSPTNYSCRLQLSSGRSS